MTTIRNSAVQKRNHMSSGRLAQNDSVNDVRLALCSYPGIA